jgi:H+-transporting ATPase
VFLTQVFALFISVYGVLAEPIGWPWGATVLSISLVYFMLLDFVKVWLYKVCDVTSTHKYYAVHHTLVWFSVHY